MNHSLPFPAEDVSTKPPMKNVSRERMKVEKAFLRTQIHQLEQQYSQTLAAKALEWSHMPSSVWRDLALRQAARRHKAERERDQLRARLVHQLDVTKHLEEILFNRMQHQCEDHRDSHLNPIDNLALLHDQLVDEIDKLYPHVETMVFDPTNSHNTVKTSVQRSKDDQKLYVEIQRTSKVPFPVLRVSSLLWCAITTLYHRQQRVLEEYRCTDEEFSCKLMQYRNEPECTVPLTVALVMRKFTEATRVVFVWRSMDWDAQAMEKRGLTEDTGCLVIHPTIDAVSGEEHSIVQVCNRTTPIGDLQIKLMDAENKGFSQQEIMNRILYKIQADIAAITESFEHILLGDVMDAHEDQLERMVGDLFTP